MARVLALGTREQMRLLPLGAGSRVLDLGAGDGRLAYALASAGHHITAVEPFRSVKPSRRIEVLREDLSGLELPAGSFDAAVLWHVLEHLPAPFDLVERVRRWLVPGGRILVGVPNLASLQAEVGGERWFHLDLERHFVHFTPAGLVALLDRAGFMEVELHRVVLEQAIPGMWMTLLNRLTRKPDALRRFVRHEPVERRDLLVTAGAAAPLLPIAGLLELAAALAGRGGALGAVGRAP